MVQILSAHASDLLVILWLLCWRVCIIESVLGLVNQVSVHCKSGVSDSKLDQQLLLWCGSV